MLPLLLALAACESAGAAVDVPDVAAVAWLGGAIELPQDPLQSLVFVDWQGAMVSPKIVSGPQGGQHIWVGVRAKNVWPQKLRMAVQMWDAETGELVKPGRVEITHTVTAGPDGWLEYTGIPAYVKLPCAVQDRKLRVRLEISDLYGVAAAQEAFIRPKWDGFCPQ